MDATERLGFAPRDDAAIEMRMQEFDGSDAEWRDLTGDLVLSTDQQSEEETFAHIISFLGLP